MTLPSIYEYLPEHADALVKAAHSRNLLRGNLQKMAAVVNTQPPKAEAPHPYRRAIQMAAISGLGIGLGYMGGRAAALAVDPHMPLGQLPMFVGPALAWGAGYLAGKRQEVSDEEMRRAYELKNNRTPGRLSR